MDGDASFSFLNPTAAAASGIAAYIFYFHHGEHHLHPYRIIQSHLVVLAIIVVARSNNILLPTTATIYSTAALFLIYLASLYGATAVYRLFLNPLNEIPGPFLARLSKFQHVYQNRHLKGHHELEKLHAEFGRFVRIGPNDISVIDADAMQVISGPSSKCYKAPWYNHGQPYVSLHTIRDRAQHDQRRKEWRPAFSPKALKGYEERVRRYNDILIEGLKEGRYGKEVNVSNVFNLYSFDVMGDLAFGRSFDMLKSGKEPMAFTVLNEGLKIIGLALPTWVFRILIEIPGAAKGRWAFVEYCDSLLNSRLKEQSDRVEKLKAAESGAGGEEKDIIYTLIQHFEKIDDSQKRAALLLLQGDAQLIVVAGSDTTASALVHLFYYLAADKHLVERLRGQIEKGIGNDGQLIHQRIVDAELLNGCIYEALRLHPPVPSGVFRKTPKEGVYVGDRFIPGNTTIQTPWFVMGRDEAYFQDAKSFRPERWSQTSTEKLVKHKDAWAPFSIGPDGCIGKNLAMMEMRTVTAQVLQYFDVSLADGEDGSSLFNDTIDHFTQGLAPLRLVFEERRQAL